MNKYIAKSRLFLTHRNTIIVFFFFVLLVGIFFFFFPFRTTQISQSTPHSVPPVVLTATPTLSEVPSPTTTYGLSFPIRGMFYYPWFPETWKTETHDPFTHYQPTKGFYTSSDEVVIREHIRAMQYAGMQVGIFEWNGQKTMLDKRIPLLLRQAGGTNFYWAAYYNQEGLSVGNGPNPTSTQIASDLSYLKQQYASDSRYASINGRPLVLVYGDPDDTCGMAERWKEANAGVNLYIVLKVFPGYQDCLSQPDGWHQYNPELSQDSQSQYSYTISPGFWKADESSPRLARSPEVFAQNIRNMVSSRARFHLVTSFNEWGEGTAIESAREWESSSEFGIYGDILHSILVEKK